MRVAIACDHAGFNLKAAVAKIIADLGHEVINLGTDSPDVKSDYPDVAQAVGVGLLDGAAQPVAQVIGVAGHDHGRQPVDLDEIEYKRRRNIWEVEGEDARGNDIEMHVDATTGRVLKMERD